jgi:hypothetical protein
MLHVENVEMPDEWRLSGFELVKESGNGKNDASLKVSNAISHTTSTQGQHTPGT